MLRSALLHYAPLHYAPLRSAQLRSAPLNSALLCSAQLCSAPLSSGPLRSAPSRHRMSFSPTDGQTDGQTDRHTPDARTHKKIWFSPEINLDVDSVCLHNVCQKLCPIPDQLDLIWRGAATLFCGIEPLLPKA